MSTSHNKKFIASSPESRFIAACLIDGTLDRLNENRGLPIAAFEDSRNRKTWQQLRTAKTLDEVESIALPYAAVAGGDGMSFIEDRTTLYFSALKSMGFHRVDEWRSSLPSGMKGDPLTAMEARRLDLSKPPQKPAPVLTCSGLPVALRGDITAVLAPAKSGKSAWVGAAIAAAVAHGENIETSIDCLGIAAGARPDSSVVLVVDTEQSEADQYELAQRVARRSKVPILPDWVQHYNMVGAAPSEIRTMLTAKLAALKAAGVPVWFVVIDGIADLCNDPNDIRESQDLVREVHGHARAFDCTIIAVIHRNEGRDADASARGHLGKQLARKAAFNLTLEKDSHEVTVVFSTKNRGAPILKDNGPRFRWDMTAGMHVSVEPESTLRYDEKCLELRRLADEVFGGDRLRYAEACRRIEEARRVKEKAAEKWFTNMKKANVIVETGMGFWAKSAP